MVYGQSETFKGLLLGERIAEPQHPTGNMAAMTSKPMTFSSASTCAAKVKVRVRGRKPVKVAWRFSWWRPADAVKAWNRAGRSPRLRAYPQALYLISLRWTNKTPYKSWRR